MATLCARSFAKATIIASNKGLRRCVSTSKVSNYLYLPRKHNYTFIKKLWPTDPIP